MYKKKYKYINSNKLKLIKIKNKIVNKKPNTQKYIDLI